MKRFHGIIWRLMMIAVLAPLHGAAAPDAINIASQGKAQCVIVVPAGTMAERHVLNELGSGGLMGPILLYREK